MKQTTNTNKITSILLGFVLLSGTLAFAFGPTQAFAGDRQPSNAESVGILAGDPPSGPGAVISNGVVDLGITNGGSLIANGVGLRLAGNAGSESVAIAFLGEGWGVGAASIGTFGGVNLGSGNLNVEVPSGSFSSTATTADTVAFIPTIADPDLRVEHSYSPSSSTDLYLVEVTIVNVGDTDIADVEYRRIVDWDIPPTRFNEFVTLDGTGLSPLFAAGGANGFGNINTSSNPGSLGCGAPDYVDCGPGDRGTWTDLSLGPLAVGEGVQFDMYYGVSTTEAAADAARALVGAPMYSYGQSNGGQVTGSPSTHIMAFPDNTSKVVEVCDDTNQICKQVVIIEDTPDGVIEVNEHITYEVTITVDNNSGNVWNGVTVHDRFAGDLAVGDTTVVLNPAPHAQPDDIDFANNLDCDDESLTQKGKTQKEFLDCAVSGDGNLDPGESASVGVTAETDFNPGQGKKGEIAKRSYTSCSNHDVNSGASVEFTLDDGTIIVLQTPPVTVSVLEFADLSGDCDDDGFTDGEELNVFGTDPHDPRDNPTCEGINTIDDCIDGDGIATPLRGAFSAVWGDPLTTWPTSAPFFGPEGIDWFDNDGSLSWTLGDDLHLEDPGGSCPTGIRVPVHDAGLDCVVLDLNASLFDGQPVSCDLETGTFCGGARIADLASTGIKFTDGEVAADGDYNNSEDIIKDNNNNGIFD